MNTTDIVMTTYLGGAVVMARITYVRLRTRAYDKLIHQCSGGKPHRITPNQLARAEDWYRSFDRFPVVMKTLGAACWWPVVVPIALLFSPPRPRGLEKTALEAVENHRLQERIRELEQENERYRDGLH